MWCVTIALSKMGPAAYPATEALTEALNNASDDVRWGAAIALGNIGARARSAIPALMNALSDPDQDVRMGASLALDHIDPGAVKAHTDWHSIAATIDSLTPGLMKETRVPGVSVARINKSALVWSRQFGAADAKSNLAVTNETMFEA